MKTQQDIIIEAYIGMVSEGKFLQTHLKSGKPNPNHPNYETHKANFSSAKVSKDENPIKMHHLDAAISNSYPDVEPYEHLARKFPELHKTQGKSGSKLTDLANDTIKKNTKHKTYSDYADATYKEIKSDMGE